MYVWVDALANYITATGFPDSHAPRGKFWPASAHLIGKDITRFHAVYWPAFLLSAKLPLPRQIVVHGHLFNRGAKMSKSVGNIVDPFALAGNYGADQLRYFLLRDVPFGQDGSYSHEAIVTRINSDLANDLGNLAQRCLSMVASSCGGQMPVPSQFNDADTEILAAADALLEKARTAMQSFALHIVLADIWRLVADANRYFAAEQPWIKRKTDPARMDAILCVTAEVLRKIAILAQPFMPAAMTKLLDLLGVEHHQRSFEHLGQTPAKARPLPAPSPIFPRYVEADAAS
jgi:methionyl-tRNA synthetase